MIALSLVLVLTLVDPALPPHALGAQTANGVPLPSHLLLLQPTRMDGNTAKTGEQQVNTGAALRFTEPSYFSFLEAEEQRGAEDDVAAGAAGGRKLEMEPGY
jgi:hypothetical protein